MGVKAVQDTGSCNSPSKYNPKNSASRSGFFSVHYVIPKNLKVESGDIRSVKSLKVFEGKIRHRLLGLATLPCKACSVFIFWLVYSPRWLRDMIPLF